MLLGVDEPHSVVRGGGGASGVHYYLQDAAGNITALVGSTGALENQYSYLPFGSPETKSETVENPLQFSARELDAETGLYYVRARYYDATLGRFISEDPIGLSGGINPYSYAGNAPLDHNDPSGMWTEAEILERIGRPINLDSNNNGFSAFSRGVSTFGFAGDREMGWTGPIGRGLTSDEIRKLGTMCDWIDCHAVTVVSTPFSRSFAFGHTIYLSGSDEGNFSALAHEMTHVVQYDMWGMRKYLMRGLEARRQEWRGRNPYEYAIVSGRSFWSYRMEQQAMMVQDCAARIRSASCTVVPFKLNP